MPSVSRRTREQRREDYLDAGASIIGDRTLGDDGDASLALAHVKLAEVADIAGVTKGAMYHLWSSQEAFWQDLLTYMLDEHQLFGSKQLVALAEDLPDDSTGIVMLRQYANLLFDTLKDDPSFYIRIAVFSYLGDEALSSRLDAEFREGLGGVMESLETAVAEMGRRPIEGATMWDFAVSIGAMLEGLCLQYRLGPGRTPGITISDEDASGGPTDLTLFTAAAEALLYAYTEPIDAAADDPPARL